MHDIINYSYGTKIEGKSIKSTKFLIFPGYYTHYIICRDPREFLVFLKIGPIILLAM